MFIRMLNPYRIAFHAYFAMSIMALSYASAWAQVNDATSRLETRHAECLERITEDADLAYEEALIWRADGGGRRAKHCVAMSLFALGHTHQAASRLETLADSHEGGSHEIRTDLYTESADFWLVANAPKQAYLVATRGLDLKPDHIPLRISRARAYALLDRYADAEIDLSSVLAFEPDHALALRYRADARRHQGELEAALEDAERALELDPTQVETAVVRGDIKEAIRLDALKQAAQRPTDLVAPTIK